MCRVHITANEHGIFEIIDLKKTFIDMYIDTYKQHSCIIGTDAPVHYYGWYGKIDIPDELLIVSPQPCSNLNTTLCIYCGLVGVSYTWCPSHKKIYFGTGKYALCFEDLNSVTEAPNSDPKCNIVPHYPQLTSPYAVYKEAEKDTCMYGVPYQGTVRQLNQDAGGIVLMIIGVFGIISWYGDSNPASRHWITIISEISIIVSALLLFFIDLMTSNLQRRIYQLGNGDYLFILYVISIICSMILILVSIIPSIKHTILIRKIGIESLYYFSVCGFLCSDNDDHSSLFFISVIGIYQLWLFANDLFTITMITWTHLYVVVILTIDIICMTTFYTFGIFTHIAADTYGLYSYPNIGGISVTLLFLSMIASVISIRLANKYII